VFWRELPQRFAFLRHHQTIVTIAAAVIRGSDEINRASNRRATLAMIRSCIPGTAASRIKSGMCVWLTHKLFQNPKLIVH
jgi:hypothetical protein